jgi:cytidine deaminase
VGAAVESDAGIFTGCNVENASFGLSMCAERVALFAAVAGGARHIVRLVVCCTRADAASPPGTRMPCGACRQVMSELMDPECEVVIDGLGVWRVADLAPVPFQLEERPFLDGPR